MATGPAEVVARLPLPDHAHIPGRNTRPGEGFLADLGIAVLAETRDEAAADNIAWRYGVRLFNAGFFFEAHEALEPVWMTAPPNSRERHLVAAVIQMANAALKQVMGRERAVARLLDLAADRLEQAFAGGAKSVMGLSRVEATAALEALRRNARDSRAFLRLDLI